MMEEYCLYWLEKNTSYGELTVYLSFEMILQNTIPNQLSFPRKSFATKEHFNFKGIVMFYVRRETKKNVSTEIKNSTVTKYTNITLPTFIIIETKLKLSTRIFSFKRFRCVHVI